MGGKEEVGWRVGKEKRQWVKRSEGGQEERMIVTYNTNWLLQSTRFIPILTTYVIHLCFR